MPAHYQPGEHVQPLSPEDEAREWNARQRVAQESIKISPETWRAKELIGLLWQSLQKENPQLSTVHVEDVSARSDATFEFTAGDFVPPARTQDKPKIRIATADVGSLENMLTTREASVRIIAELLDLPFEKISKELLLAFILAHEAGHAQDFVTNYQDVGSDKLANSNVWTDQYIEQLDTLPVPRLTPSDLKNTINNSGGYVRFCARFSLLPQRLADRGITSEEQLLVAQERAYRSLPRESYADQFAASHIKQHAVRLGLTLD